MTLQAKRPKPKLAKLSPQLVNAIAAADAFVRSARERAAAEKTYKDAKACLVAFLAGAATRQLPDGRTVCRAVVSYPPYQNPGYDAVTVTVLPAPTE